MGRNWLLALCAVACGRGTPAAPTPDTGFSISYPQAPSTGVTVEVGARFHARPVARCFYDNGREARWTMGNAKIVSGSLPDGFTIEDGVIGGLVGLSGTYRATIELTRITCAGKVYPNQSVDVLIIAK